MHYAWFVLAAATLAVFGSLGLARFGYTVVLPSMQDGLGLNNTQAGGLATANLLGYSALALLGGALASRFGPRIVITGGLLLAALGMLATGLAQGFAAAALWRLITGMGSGAGNVSAMGLLAAWFGERRRGLASGVAVAGSSIALIALGPTVPRVIAQVGEDGWRASWLLFAAVTLGLAILCYFVLRDAPGDVGLRPLGGDTRGAYESAPPTAGDAGVGVGVDGVAAAGDVVAPAVGGGREGGLQWGLVYRSPAVWHLGVVYVAFGFSYIIYMTFFTKHLIQAGGYSPEQAGSLFMTTGWSSLLCGVIWGGVSDKIGRKWALVIVYLIQATAFALFELWAVPAGFLISAVLFGLTAWSIPAIMAAACGDALGSRLAPAALGFITLFFALGQSAAPTVAGAIADASGGFGPAFLLASGVALLGAVLASFLRSPTRSS